MHTEEFPKTATPTTSNQTHPQTKLFRRETVRPYDEGDPIAGELLDPSVAQSFRQNLSDASRQAFRGGAAGAAAMGANVACLMWMRTTIYYQYRNGTTFTTALRTLYTQGGVPRFYRGIVPALIQGPLGRFGDTAANTGVLTFMNTHEYTKDWSSGIKTATASIAAGLFRIVIMPIDTIKTSMQVHGSIQPLLTKMKVAATTTSTSPIRASRALPQSFLSGPLVLFHGSTAAASATIIGHFPWYFTFNYLSDRIPKNDSSGKFADLGRLAFIGFVSSAVSDTCSNCIRVVKVNRQTSNEPISYVAAARTIIQESGWTGLFFRGLETKLLANGLQGILFSILWKNFEEILFSDENHQKK